MTQLAVRHPIVSIMNMHWSAVMALKVYIDETEVEGVCVYANEAHKE